MVADGFSSRYVPTMPSASDETTSSLERQRWFTTTHWSVVLAANTDETGVRTDALERLCRDYWYPLYAYVRRRGHDPQDAADLTQGFFERLLQGSFLRDADQARGKFRSFLLGSLKHFLSDQHDRVNAEKRGGGRPLISLDAHLAEGRYGLELTEDQSPDKLFERSWAVMTLERVVEQVRKEYADSGKAELFNGLKLFLWGELDAANYGELAQRLGMTEAALKMAATRLRQRCREVLRSEVANTVSEPEAIEEELRYLISVLRS